MIVIIDQSEPVIVMQDNFSRRYREAVILRDVYFIGSVISLLLLIATIFIFTYFKSVLIYLFIFAI